jgi:amidohydrolase
MNGLKREANDLAEDLVRWRRDFHRYPEIAFEEKRTGREIARYLEDLEIPVTRPAETGVRGVLNGLLGGRTVALRADMDALPLTEEGDKDYISRNPGAAHACGHDGHMAVLMGAAELLRRRRNEFKGTVVFLFQPSEERSPGGAVRMVEEGVLEGVEAVFGLHFWQPMATGTVGLVKGAMMAQTDDFRITIRGKGGHGAMPHQAVDTILTAAQIVVNMQSVISRNVDPLKPAVLSFGTIKGGTVYNIIPAEVKLSGTVRTLEPEVKTLVETRLRAVAAETAQTFGAEVEVDYFPGFPPVVNHPQMVDLVLRVVRDKLGEDRIREINPVMGGEDFAYYLQKVPGAFLFFGMGTGCPWPHHHPRFDMDEAALPEAAELMARIALEYLST